MSEDKPSYQFQLGNKAWKSRNSHGRKLIFKNSDELWDACVEYFEWVEANPLKATFYKGRVFDKPVEIIRPMTEKGLCVFLGINRNTLSEYKLRQGFIGVTTRVCDVIYINKFEGAATGLFESNIIARDLGLAEKQEIKQEFGIDDLSRLEAEAEKRGWKRTNSVMGDYQNVTVMA